MNETLDSKNNAILLLNPNLGHPLILNIDANLKQDEFYCDLLFATELTDLVQFSESIQSNVGLIPIMEYRWEIPFLLERANLGWLGPLIDTEKKSIWQKIKGFFLKKKRRIIKQDLLKKPLEFLDSVGKKFHFPEKGKFQKVKARAFRGSELKATISNIKFVNMCDLDNLEYDSYCSPRNYLIKQDILGALKVFYKVQIKFFIRNEIKEFLKSHNFIMFDINIHLPNADEKINYHSIVLSKNNWNNLKIVQASDLHLAERNDRIYEIVKNWTSLFRQSNIGEMLSEGAKTLNFFQRLFTPKIKKGSKEYSATPLKKRYINPNNNFRTFIKLMNKQVLNNELDFVVLTGDLIDFAILSRFPKDLRKLVDFEYNRTNWRVFKEIVLNFPQEKKRGMVKGEELLCPIFTILGNHDYRPFHYDIRWGGLYRKIGLNANEALALNDELMANPISSITKTFQTLKAYLKEINSSLDYFLKLGHINLIFLNTGSDSFKKIMDFVSGHPSLTGLSHKQIKYLEILVNKKIEKEDTTFLFLHGPPINPKNTISLFKRFDLPKYKDEVLTKIDEYMESRVLMLGKEHSAARIDGKFDVKYGVVSSNWEKLLFFCKNYCDLTLCGHTHQLNEFKLGDPSDALSKNLQYRPFPIEKIENPAAIYYDIYSEMYSTAKEVEKNGPFVVQTPALGLGSYFNPKLSGAYREIKITDGKLVSFKVKTIKK